jgi:hypothetical protein
MSDAPVGLGLILAVRQTIRDSQRTHALVSTLAQSWQTNNAMLVEWCLRFEKHLCYSKTQIAVQH